MAGSRCWDRRLLADADGLQRAALPRMPLVLLLGTAGRRGHFLFWATVEGKIKAVQSRKGLIRRLVC